MTSHPSRPLASRFVAHCLGLAALLMSAALPAAEVHVAVAANFAAPMRSIVAEFERSTGHEVRVSLGSTGKFYAQIVNGAPFEVFLAADDTTPARLEREGLAVPGSRFTYSIGRLVLWSPRPGVVDENGAVLRGGRFRHLALANPRLAPYGVAAIETLTALGLLEQVRARFVQGENIAQAFQFVSSGNADLGFVALAQVFADQRITRGSAWIVPEHLHQPIRQDAVLLARGRDNPAAAALLRFLQTPHTRALIRAYGYTL